MTPELEEDPGKVSRHLRQVHPADTHAKSGACGHPGSCHRGRGGGAGQKGSMNVDLLSPPCGTKRAWECALPHQRSASLENSRSGKKLALLQATKQQGQVLTTPMRIPTGQ